MALIFIAYRWAHERRNCDSIMDEDSTHPSSLYHRTRFFFFQTLQRARGLACCACARACACVQNCQKWEFPRSVPRTICLSRLQMESLKREDDHVGAALRTAGNIGITRDDIAQALAEDSRAINEKLPRSLLKRTKSMRSVSIQLALELKRQRMQG